LRADVAAPAARPELDGAEVTIAVRGPRWNSPSSWQRGDRICIGVLVTLPLLLFVPLALAGHPAISADNLLQNYPLRILSARQIDAGHWPTWNPYSYSGTPLLAGMNAGSLFPGTLLFTFLPGIVAWIVNLVVVYWCAGIGLYALVRWLGMAPAASGLAAVTYAFGGEMVGQLVHVGVIQGQAMLPLVILCQLILGRTLLSSTGAERTASLVRRALPATLWLAVLCGLIGLTGEPRSIVDAEVVVSLVACFELVFHGSSALATARGRIAYVAATATAVGVGLCVAAVQLLPGWNFITTSERSNITYQFFGLGSMPWRWMSLLVDPGVLGDNGVAHTSRFFATYNLPEVTSYVGLLALAAILAFTAQLFVRSQHQRRILAPFLALAVVGVVTATGSTTPLGHLFHHLPLFGKTRLQNRNLIFFDLGASVLLAWWLDAIFKGRFADASLTGRRKLVTLSPVVLALGLGTWGAISPASLAGVIAPHTPTGPAGGARPVLIASALLGIVLLVVFFARLDLRRLSRALVAFAIVDLAFFNLFFETGLISGLASPFPDTPQAHEILGTHGRIAIVDPGVLSYHLDASLGFGNLDAYTQLQSVQGYGSLIAARYSEATGVRLLGTLGGCQLARGDFVQLRLEVLAISRNAFVGTPRHRGSCASMREPTTKRFFGLQLRIKRIRFAGPDVGLIGPSARVRIFTPNGHTTAVPVRTSTNRRSVLLVSFPTRPSAVGVELVVPGGARVNSTIVYPVHGAVEPLNTSLQVGLSVQPWHLVSVQRHLSFFRSKIRPPVWLIGSPSGVARVKSSNAEGGLFVEVTSPVPTTLVRSEAWLPGWVARVHVVGSTKTVTRRVTPNGLVQSVRLPAGTVTVQFSYIAPFLAEGQAVSLAGLALLLAGLVALVILRRRHPAPSAPMTTPATA
jgi:hypothetical protein